MKSQLGQAWVVVGPAISWKSREFPHVSWRNELNQSKSSIFKPQKDDEKSSNTIEVTISVEFYHWTF